MFCNHSHYLVPDNLYHPTKKPCNNKYSLASFSLEFTNLLSICEFAYLFRINGITQYVAFCDILLLLGIIFSRFIYVLAYVGTSFLFMIE